jgi:hypothetical protein
MRGLVYSLCCLCFLATGRSEPSREAPFRAAAASSGWDDGQARQPDSPGSSAAANGRIDACALITKAEIEAVQGEAVKETKSSELPSGLFVMSQCLFRTPTFAKSVSLALATPDPLKRSALTPREFWRKQVHPPEHEKGAKAEKGKEEKPAAGKAKTPKETEEEREKELSKPRVIDGLGEEAYWMGSPITGALYVLKGDAFLRISVGGEKDESVRIKKAKTLAEKALKRLDALATRPAGH